MGMDTRMLVIIGVMLVCGCVEPPSTSAPSDFQVEYTRSSPVPTETEFYQLVTILPDGSWERSELDQRGTTVTGSGTLTEAQMDGLYSVVVESDFFSLPEELSVPEAECTDMSTEHLEITANGKTHKSGGYCLASGQFKMVTDKLSELTA